MRNAPTPSIAAAATATAVLSAAALMQATTQAVRRQAWQECGTERCQTALIAHASAAAEPSQGWDVLQGGPGWGYGAKCLSKVWPAEACSRALARLAYFRPIFHV